MSEVTHYEPGVVYKEDEEGWRVEAGCGEVIWSGTVKSKDYTTTDLSLVSCNKCKEVYSLEILAEVP